LFLRGPTSSRATIRSFGRLLDKGSFNKQVLDSGSHELSRVWGHDLSVYELSCYDSFVR
jgi:hypothetical protein